MKTKWTGPLLVMFFLQAALPLTAMSDVAVLADGSTVEGNIRVARGYVIVENRNGVLRLPQWRVQHVATADAELQHNGPWDEATEQPKRGDVAPREPAPVARAAPRTATTEQAGPPSVRAVLEQKVDIDFEATPLVDALDYLRQVTGANVVVHESVRRDVVGVHMALRDVPVRTVLDVLLKPRGFGYQERPGEILYIGPRVQTLQLRVYPVTDLLVSTEDTGTAEGARGGAGRGGGQLNPQFGFEAGRARISAAPSSSQSPQYLRAQALVELIRQSCGRAGWQAR